MTPRKSIEHIYKGRCKKTWKTKTPTEINEELESNPASYQCKLISAVSVQTDGL